MTLHGVWMKPALAWMRYQESCSPFQISYFLLRLEFSKQELDLESHGLESMSCSTADHHWKPGQAFLGVKWGYMSCVAPTDSVRTSFDDLGENTLLNILSV